MEYIQEHNNTLGYIVVTRGKNPVQTSIETGKKCQVREGENPQPTVNYWILHCISTTLIIRWA